MSDSGLSTNGAADAESIAASLLLIPDDVKEETAETLQEPPPVLPTLDPWAGVNVAWLLPLAGKLIQLPYEQVAKKTKDDCWLVTDDQIQILNPSLENALKWTVWRLGAANTIGHPLVALAVAVGSLTAVKYGIYQFNQSQRDAGGPQRPIQANHPPTPTDTTTTNGRTVGSAGASSSAASQGAASPGSSRKEFVIAAE